MLNLWAIVSSTVRIAPEIAEIISPKRCGTLRSNVSYPIREATAATGRVSGRYLYFGHNTFLLFDRLNTVPVPNKFCICSIIGTTKTCTTVAIHLLLDVFLGPILDPTPDSIEPLPC